MKAIVESLPAGSAPVGDDFGRFAAEGRRTQEAGIASEIELKLAVRARDLPALRQALEAHAAPGGRNGAVRLVSTYFDTPDRQLARRGLVLRVRERDGEFIQTVKSAARAGIAALARGEWEDPVGGAEPDPHGLETGRFLEPDIVRDLVPMFRTEVARETIELCPAPETHIEVAIDRGWIRLPVGTAREAISEIELELKSGCPRPLYDVALDLLAHAPVRLEWRSKAERGYRLAASEHGPVGAVHAAAADLDPGLNGEEGFRRIGLACLNQILRNEPAVIAGVPDGIHQMRVAVRRLRAILSAFGKMLPRGDRHRASRELRWLAGELAPARDLDVFGAALLLPAQAAVREADIAALTAAAERRRSAAYRAAAKAVGSTRYTSCMLQLLRWFDTRGWRHGERWLRLAEPIEHVAARVLDRRYRIVKRRSRGFAGQSGKQRHQLRIALKKLRYAAEALVGIYQGAAVANFVRSLKRLQDDLGDSNDLEVGREIVAGLAASGGRRHAIASAGAAVLDWHERRLATREPALRRDFARLLEAAPFWPR